MGGVQRWRSSVAWGVLGQASLSAYGVKPVEVMLSNSIWDPANLNRVSDTLVTA
jgi:hypothetical protein